MTPSASLHALLAGAIDYAGLFPPAKLEMRDAVARYADYRGTAEAWALGRFVLPLSRVDELAAVKRDIGAQDQSWRLSVLLGEDPTHDAARIRSFNAAHPGSILIDSAEVKLSNPAASTARKAVGTFVERLPQSVRLFVEVPVGGDLAPFIAPIAAANACAKIRTGGVTEDQFPDAPQVARFLTCCAEHDVSFKATAGLHHPWRGRYPVTYETGAPTTMMFGFLNVMVAAALAHAGATTEEVLAALTAERGSDFRFGDDDILWRDERVSRQTLFESHATFALSFGSCSFEEPLYDLRRLALL
jgi:hypothetical protein